MLILTIPTSHVLVDFTEERIFRTLYINEKIAATVFFKKMAGFLCKSEL